MLVSLALITGVVGGLGAILFRLMIDWAGRGIREVFRFLPGVPHFPPPRHDLAVLAPAVGLVLVGLIGQYLASEVRGHGIPQVLEALALRGGRIRPRVALLGIVAPAVTIGSGGSVGQEGPIALIGASFGSVIGQLLRLSDRYLSLLVASGAAAGVAATFNAPIAGALFGMEVVLGSHAMGVILPTLVAAVTGTVTFNSIMGNRLVLPTATFGLGHPAEILAMLLLGAVAGLMGLAYTRGLDLVETASARWRVPFWLKPLLGGVLVALLGMVAPQVLGVGYDTMERAVAGDLVLAGFFWLLVLKYLATLITIAAGGSGGVFAPSLYLGTMLGGSFGAAMHLLMPDVVAVPQAYAVVGMGAVFAAAAQAPLTAITIILEMTGDYEITVGVMAACAMSYFVYGFLARDSMYTVRLTRKGIVVLRGTEIRPAERITVSAAQRQFSGGCPASTSVAQAYGSVSARRHRSLVVVDDRGELLGVVSADDLRRALLDGKSDVPVGDVASRNVVTVYPDQSLEDAMRLFAVYDYRMLPVVSRQNPGRVVGILGRDDVLRAYNAHTLHGLETSRKVQLLCHLARDQGSFGEVVLPASSPISGRTLAELELPPQCLLVSVTREGSVLIPHGRTRLEPGDRLLVFCSPSECLEEVENYLRGGSLASTGAAGYSRQRRG
ncbi:MAG: chloride channel protein [Bacillota bacterium]|nr:chloride channel protein [Bacillota bacterium]